MLQRLSSGVLLASLFVLTGNAGAQPAPAARPAATPEQRRDARGLRGISPFMEALKRADGALLARDLEGAIVAYRDAIAKEPENALGQYRLGEAQILKGDLPEAEQAFSAGLRLVSAATPGLKAKLQFALSDVRERQKAYGEASAEWTVYEAFTTAQKQPFSDTAVERKRVLEAWKKLSQESLEVKSRSEKGVQAADEAVRKSSQ